MKSLISCSMLIMQNALTFVPSASMLDFSASPSPLVAIEPDPLVAHMGFSASSPIALRWHLVQEYTGTEPFRSKFERVWFRTK
jgi:hypothetical protein